MKIDAHYYAVLAFSRACGFKKEHAWDIAYASQFVDDAKINHIVPQDSSKVKEFEDIEIIDSKPCFFDMSTCHSYNKIATYNYNSMIKNTVPFHFIPGCEGGNFVKRMRCKQNGDIIRKLFDKVIERGNLIELGMVLHVFADTYSHQGFSGLLSKVNDIKDLKAENNSGRLFDRMKNTFQWAKCGLYSMFDKVIPAYGHGQAISFPDLPYLSWSYTYDSSDIFSDKAASSKTIDNVKRFRNAFTEIEKFLKEFAANHPTYIENTWPSFNTDTIVDSLTVKKSDKGRVRHLKKTIMQMGLFDENDPMLDYDAHAWLKDAFSNFDKKKFSDRKVEGATLADGFEQSKWYAFYKAVHWYKSAFFDCCENTGNLVIHQ